MLNRRSLKRTVDSGGGIYSRIYNVIMILSIVVGIIPLLFRGETSFLLTLDIISCIVFTTDYLLRWATCDVGEDGSKIKAFLAYPFSPMAIIDLLSIVPTLGVFNPTFKLLRITRLFKILRVFKFFRYYKPLRLMSSVIRKEAHTLMTVFGFAVFYVFLTALIMFNSEKPINPETGEYVFTTFFDALYWAACTLTTVGYGDITPVSSIGRLVSMISAMVGVAIIALPSGVITASYLEELKKNGENEKKHNAPNTPEDN